MTVKVFFDDLKTASRVNEIVGGELNSEEASIDLEATCPHEAREQIQAEVKSSAFSVATVIPSE